mgnify:FL=1
MAKKVELLILDEPTAALNDEESRRLLDIMLDLKSHGITSIIISHKLNEISYVLIPLPLSVMERPLRPWRRAEMNLRKTASSKAWWAAS